MILRTTVLTGHRKSLESVGTTAIGRCVRSGLAVIAACILINAAPVSAATLVNEAVLDGVFSQESFGNTPIDIRLLPVITIESNRLSRVDVSFSGGGFTGQPLVVTRDDARELFDMGTAGPVLDFFLVDQINFAFGNPAGITEDLSDPNVFTPVFGNGFIVDRDFSFGTDRELIVAHEMGHTLGLRHPDDPEPPFFLPPAGFFPPNLMNSVFSGSKLLTEAQVAQIFQSDNLQGDAMTGYFIEVQQYDVVREPLEVAAVPLPASAPLMLAGAVCFGWAGRRRRLTGQPTQPEKVQFN